MYDGARGSGKHGWNSSPTTHYVTLEKFALFS